MRTLGHPAGPHSWCAPASAEQLCPCVTHSRAAPRAHTPFKLQVEIVPRSPLTPSSLESLLPSTRLQSSGNEAIHVKPHVNGTVPDPRGNNNNSEATGMDALFGHTVSPTGLVGLSITTAVSPSLSPSRIARPIFNARVGLWFVSMKYPMRSVSS